MKLENEISTENVNETVANDNINQINDQYHEELLKNQQVESLVENTNEDEESSFTQEAIGESTNEDEIKTLYKTPSLNVEIEKLKKKCDLAAITIGKKGSILISNGQIINVDPFIFGKAIDTTGAGDLYAGGFLKGLADGREPEVSAKIGSICAGHIVTQLGSRSNTDLLSLITSHLEI